ncbi:MAG: hypothetical protein ACTHKQ_18300, partial [Mesorhizobium sp.]
KAAERLPETEETVFIALYLNKYNACQGYPFARLARPESPPSPPFGFPDAAVTGCKGSRTCGDGASLFLV